MTDNIKKKTYECDITDSFISIEYNNKIFWIEKYFIDNISSESNLFGLLLSRMINDMKSKKIKYLTMTINIDDWNSIKKNDKWTVINNIEKEQLVEIQCNIDDVFDCILDGFNCQ